WVPAPNGWNPSTSAGVMTRSIRAASARTIPVSFGPMISAQSRVQAGLTPAPSSTLAYLLWRRSLNPARFDFYHPGLGPLLAKEAGARAATSQIQTCPPLNGILPNTPFVNYLLWRRSLNPARFDFYHPRLGPLLALDQFLKSQMPMNCP